ncbi:peptidoglycan bridge formation glycyltransferase FemA/FemB family protein [Microgenomates group bacterium]|nr:peptidoglycan bridge formation glycyltransferase FemA/FemB family protein [Microgenomates group bacterium]
MLARLLDQADRTVYDKVVDNPIQSWAWGEFKQKTGSEVVRIGFFGEDGKMVDGVQVIFKPMPMTGWIVGHCSRSSEPTPEQLQAITDVAKERKAVFVKLEPNISVRSSEETEKAKVFGKIEDLVFSKDGRRGKPLFTNFTFVLNLGVSEEELMTRLSSKTRYNVRLASKKGVEIVEDSSKNGMETYIKLMEETTKRQQFLNHNGDYFREMHEVMEGTGMMRIFHALYQEKVLTSWIVWEFNNNLYYPYGASSNEHREVMPNNLMMWEMIKLGKAKKNKSFDMWGCLGPDANEKNPWYGFHKFKEGYGGEMREYVGTFDIVLDKNRYDIFNFVDRTRWKALRLKSKLQKS